MNNTLKIVLLVAVIVFAVGAIIWTMQNRSGARDAVKVYERETKVLSEEDKAKMRAGWTYDVKAKVWYDENFRPVGKDAKPPSTGP